jgi:oligoribonuclease NrnB/cAMP/cGMP phosphodiesterase (DHH superfamily)
VETVADLTIAYEEAGEVLVEELDKIVLQKGVWAVVLFRYQEINRKTGKFNSPKASLRRYQKYKGEYRKRDNINLSKDSAVKLVEILNDWLEGGQLGDGDGEDE